MVAGLLIFTLLQASLDKIEGCSNIIISPGASSDSSSIVAYNADSVTLYGSLYHYSAGEHLDEVKKLIWLLLDLLLTLPKFSFLSFFLYFEFEEKGYL